MDRISDLPDCILGVILSFLRTKKAVATSVLSKRWKSAWTEVHNLDLSYHNFVESNVPADHIPFITFIITAFHLIKFRPLNKVRLDWDTCVDSSYLISLIDVAIKPNVHELTLYLLGCAMYTFPITCFNCDSLRSLTLDTIFFVNDTTMVCLPRLESLKLGCAHFVSEEVFVKLIKGCPMLHYLELEGCSGYNDDGSEDFKFILSSTSLRHLKMCCGDRCTLKLSVPSLEYLWLNYYIHEMDAEKCLSSQIEAKFNIDFNKNDFPHDSIVEAVRAFEHAKVLTLSACVLQALSRATVSLSTEFKRLLKLVVKDYSCSVQDFICNSENLEVLIIDQPVQDDRRIGTSNPHDQSRWTAPVVAPRCLSKSLKKVRYNHYKGLEDEREMIRYMLEHGTALEVVQIIWCSSKVKDGEKLELLQEICDFPRKSPDCKVQFADKRWELLI